MSKKKLRIIPFGTGVVIEVEKATETSKGGILLTPNTIERGQTETSIGTLIEAGDMAFEEYKNANHRYPKIGDKVYFKKYSGIITTDKENDIELRTLQDTDVYGSPEWIEIED